MKSDKELVDLAFEAMEQAYVPYSISVGARCSVPTERSTPDAT